MTHQDGVESGKVIIVEGKTDKSRLEDILDEPVRIVCTRGTLSYDVEESLATELQRDEVYILVDADEPGMKLRGQLKQVLPNAVHLYTRKVYREVARTPIEYLVKILTDAHFEVQDRWLPGEIDNP